MFGSSASNLCVKGKADIDVCFVSEMKEIPIKSKNKKKKEKNSKIKISSSPPSSLSIDGGGGGGGGGIVTGGTDEDIDTLIIDENEIENKKLNEKYLQQSFRKTFINHIAGTIKKSKIIIYLNLIYF